MRGEKNLATGRSRAAPVMRNSHQRPLIVGRLPSELATAGRCRESSGGAGLLGRRGELGREIVSVLSGTSFGRPARQIKSYLRRNDIEGQGEMSKLFNMLSSWWSLATALAGRPSRRSACWRRECIGTERLI